jgi:DNA-binding MarR family transcriptional regulator
MADDEPADEALIYALVDLTLALANLTEVLITDVVDELDLTRPLADALWQLDPASEPPTMGRLAARLGCDPSTVTFLAARLEEKGLATRQVNPDNRRIKTVHLTQRGRDARRTLVDAMATRSPVAKLDPDAQQQLRQLLLQALPPGSSPAPDVHPRHPGGPPWRTRRVDP